MRKRLRKIAGTPGSSDLNSCPTVIGFGEDDVILQGKKPNAATRRLLKIPPGEDVIVMPKELYLRGARNLAEGG
jgi:ribosomal protein S12